MAETIPSALAGKRIVITRAAAQSEALAKELSALGAIPVILPLVSFAAPEVFTPLDSAISDMQSYDWIIFTSATAVRAVVERKHSLVHSESKLQIAAIGPATAQAVRQAGLRVEYVAETHTGVALAEELGDRLRGAKVLLPRSDRANPDLPPALRRRGAQVTEVVAYRTLRPTSADEQSLKQISTGQADAVLFFSPSAVHHFAELLGREQFGLLQDRLAIAAVGPVTAKALRQAGVQRIVIARDTTAPAVIVSLMEHFAGTPKAAPAGVKRG